MERSRLTDVLVKALSAPSTGNQITYDIETPGFGCRVTAGNAKAFVLNYRTRSGQDWAVYTSRDGRTELTTVKLGKFSLTHAEVLSGVMQREVAVLFPSDQIADDTPVKQR